MRYKLLGKSGLRVSEVCLGAMMLGVESDASAGPEESRKILEKFVEHGGNYFDTSNEVYQGGMSERVLGDFVGSDRGRYVVTTKFTNTIPSMLNPEVKDHPNAGGNHKKSMVQSVENSLKRLNTDYIDLLWIHFWEYSTDIEDVMRNVNDLVQQGKILHFGLCNTPAWVVARGQTISALRGWEPISALQYQYNLLSRDLDHEILPCARSLGITMNAYSALGGGFLTGKYTRSGVDEKKRYDNPFWREVVQHTERDYAIARKVDETADKLGVSSTAVALAWVQGHNVLPIIGARTVAQVESSLEHLGFALPEEDMRALDELSAPERSWTYNLLHAEDSRIRQLASCGMLDEIDNDNFPA
ncbi:MAG: aldo/keto reductase [Gammaproteobacteria bacterium]|nr:aldo/keto reductase [Gammaproteobacteria bacterium]